MAHRFLLYTFALVGLVATIYLAGTFVWDWLAASQNNNRPSFTVETGVVEQALNVSGTIRSESTARLAFSSPGMVEQVAVREGDQVAAGTILARLEARGLEQELAEARAGLSEAIAQQQDLLRGASSEVVSFAETNVAATAAQLERVQQEQQRAIDTARQTLLSTDLAAFPLNPQERAPAPTISGTYRCADEGTYQFVLFRSGADSGFSMRVSGLEETTVPVSFTQAVPFGECGLRARFTEDLFYNNTRWEISVPNTVSSQYLVNRNRYQTAQLTAENAIAAAADALALAERQRDRDTAPTRSEQIAQANARIAQLEARIARLEVRRDDFLIRAPFAGTVTTVDITAGESIATAPVITILGEIEQFELRVRVPEIDITELAVGQDARVTFDARRNEPVPATISFISPLPVDIDGVAYFEAFLRLEEQTAWLRSGLNADVAIITQSSPEAVRLPTGFLDSDGESTFVRTRRDEQERRVPVEVILLGSNGFAAVNGIDVGTVVIAP